MQERTPQYFQPLRNCRGLLWWKGFREKWRYSWWGAGRVIVADFLQPLAISEGQIQNGRVPLSLSIPHNTSMSTKYSHLSLRSAKNLLRIAKNTKLLFATKDGLLILFVVL
jgi:hypothetical protein